MSAAPRPLVSIVCPAKNEAGNLEELYACLEKTLREQACDWEWIVIDDHSGDETFAVITRLASADSRIRGIRLSRGFGSHAATLCGLRRARGQCAVVMASDLQDPPELIPGLLRLWREGAQVVTTTRSARPGESVSTKLFSHLYNWLVRHVGGVPEMRPRAGTFLLADRRAIDALALYRENNLSLHVLSFWIGFRHASLEYVQQPRSQGASGWTLPKKIRLLLDSVMAHSCLAARFVVLLGALAACAGIACWLMTASLPALVLGLTVGQILVAGALGEYLWRILDESRRRPQYLIEATTPAEADIVYP